METTKGVTAEREENAFTQISLTLSEARALADRVVNTANRLLGPTAVPGIADAEPASDGVVNEIACHAWNVRHIIADANVMLDALDRATTL